MCFTLAGTVWQRFVWLAHWGFRPASSSGTRASRAGQGARPTELLPEQLPGWVRAGAQLSSFDARAIMDAY